MDNGSIGKRTQKNSALQELKELNSQEKKLSSLDIQEPELRGFDANAVFEVEHKTEEKKPFLFGKRSQRKASEVKLSQSLFDMQPPVKQEQPQQTEKEEVVEPDPIDIEEEKETIVERMEETVQEAVDSIEETLEETIEKQIEEEDEQESLDLEESEEQEESFDDEDEEEEDDVDEADYQEEIEEEMEELHEADDEQSLIVKKKSFLLSQYVKEQEYLEAQSNEGFHYVKNVGKKYYFREGEPKDYYYSVNYFRKEPDADTWRQWERDGWKLVCRVSGKKKKEAGWFVFRNEEVEGEYRKEIDNELEKFRFFKKYSNSCRSTMFLFFICMACCAVTCYLQWEFKGYLIGMVICAVLFLIAFIAFSIYGRMLRHSKKTVRMLKARVRMKERQAALLDQEETEKESQEELDTDWNMLEEEVQKTGKHRMQRHVKDDNEDED